MAEAKRKSLEQRLFEAFTHRRGVNLSERDVAVLLFDDAVATQISNKASADAGIEECGGDEVRMAPRNETWREFCERLKSGTGWLGEDSES